MNTIQEEFDGYAKAVLHMVPPNSVQMIETRRAFYAGAQSVLKVMSKIGDVSDEAGAAIIEGLATEVLNFAMDVGEGKA